MSGGTLREWWVTTPEYLYTEIVCEYGGPTYAIRDFEQVQAHTAREAVSIAVKKWLADPKGHENYCQGRRSDDLCPWTGVRAEEPRCPHGTLMPLGFSDDFWCDKCRDQWHSEAQQ